MGQHRLPASGGVAGGQGAGKVGYLRGDLLRVHPPGLAGRHLRVSVLDCTQLDPDHVRAVVLVSPPGDLCGLTSLQLQILGMLAEGWSDATIAGVLTIPAGAVAGNVEDILAKLAAPARDLAVLRAVRHGLHVPPPLSQTR